MNSKNNPSNKYSLKLDPFKDSCRKCVSFIDNPPRCTVKEYVFHSEEAICETAKHCWAYCGNNLERTDPDEEFIK